MFANDRRSTQRERLLAGMIAAANRDGYAGANVSQVISHAGVSRPTFYDYFADKDDCFLQTNRDIAQRLLAQIRDAVTATTPHHAPQAAVRRLIERCEAQPAQAHFLANVTMAGGPRALDERDHTVAEIARIVEDARGKAAPKALSPDLPIGVLIGAVHRLLAPRIRSGDHDLTNLADELIVWIESYNQPCAQHRWRKLEPGPQPTPSQYASDLSLQPPRPLPPGRSRLSSVEVARNQRERIMYATAELAARKGFTATTMADITATAHVDQRVFYTHFRDKQQAFLAMHELAIQQTMGVAAGAYFSATEWPERIWRGLLAGTQFEAAHPTIAHMAYVEAHAVGSPAIQRIIDTHIAFTIFLQEGMQYTDRPPSLTGMQAIDAAIFELGYEQTRAGRAEQLPSVVYGAAYLVLAPYLGPVAANEFIDAKLGELAAAGEQPRGETGRRRPVRKRSGGSPAASQRRPRPGA